MKEKDILHYRDYDNEFTYTADSYVDAVERARKLVNNYNLEYLYAT